MRRKKLWKKQWQRENLDKAGQWQSVALKVLRPPHSAVQRAPVCAVNNHAIASRSSTLPLRRHTYQPNFNMLFFPRWCFLLLNFGSEIFAFFGSIYHLYSTDWFLLFSFWNDAFLCTYAYYYYTYTFVFITELALATSHAFCEGVFSFRARASRQICRGYFHDVTADAAVAAVSTEVSAIPLQAGRCDGYKIDKVKCR